MKQPSERGVIGAWAFQARAEADLSVEQVAERVTAKGQAVTAATIRGIESGNKKPGARLLRALASILESVPPGQVASETPEPILAAALMALADQVAGLRREREAWERGVLSALAATEGPAREALLAALVPQPLEGAQP